jgi:DNA-directed RNA polymerase specialized sigma24 family protein
MARPTSRIYSALNELCAAYNEDPDHGRDPLLAEVHRVAKMAFQNEDHAQNFVIMVWQRLPTFKDLPCAFGAWVWRRLKWRQIDYIRADQSLLDSETQVPEMRDEDHQPLSAEEALVLLACQLTQKSHIERVREPESISDPFVRQVAQKLMAGYTRDEIAPLLRVNPSALRARMSRYNRANKIKPEPRPATSNRQT